MAEHVEENENSGLDAETINHHTEDIPKPRRKKRRIIRKILLVLLVVVVLLAGYWIFEDIRWTRRLDAQLEEYRAAGQPVDIEDFAPPPTPDDNNAALAYKKAAELLELTDQQKDLVDDFSPDKIAASQDLMKAAIDANAKTLKLIRDARSMTGCDWGINYRSKSMEDLLPNFFDSRRLGKFLRSAAIYYHNTNNDAAAIDTIRDTFSLANSLRAQFLIGNVVAISIDSLACETIEAIAKNLSVAASSTAATAEKHPVSRKAVEALIIELLDEKDVRNRMTLAYLSERAFILKGYRQWLNGELSQKDISLEEGNDYLLSERLDIVVFRPWHTRELVSMLQDLSAFAEATKQPNFPGAKQLFPPLEPEKYFVDRWRRSIRDSIVLFDRVFTFYFRSIANRRMAAIVLAIRLYEIDSGARPGKLEDLVPKYLAAVPVDPFSSDGKPISYRPDLAKPVLYSVGENQKDQGGQYAESPDEAPDWDYDLVFFLSGDRPRPPRDDELP